MRPAAPDTVQGMPSDRERPALRAAPPAILAQPCPQASRCACICHQDPEFGACHAANVSTFKVCPAWHARVGSRKAKNYTSVVVTDMLHAGARQPLETAKSQPRGHRNPGGPPALTPTSRGMPTAASRALRGGRHGPSSLRPTSRHAPVTIAWKVTIAKGVISVYAVCHLLSIWLMQTVFAGLHASESCA